MVKSIDSEVVKFFKLPELKDFKISPSGKYIASINSSDGQVNLNIVNVDTKINIILQKDTSLNLKEYHWINEKEILYFSDNKGDESYCIYLWDIDSAKSVNLTPFKKTNAKLVNFLPNDNNHIIISLNLENKSKEDLYKLNIRTNKLTKKFSNPGNIVAWYTDINGHLYATKQIDGVNIKILYNYDGTFEPIIESPYSNNVFVIGESKINNSLVLLSNLNRDKTSLVHFSISQRKETEILYAHSEYDLNECRFDHENGQVLSVSYVGQKLENVVFGGREKKVNEMLEEILSYDFSWKISSNDKNRKKYIVEISSDLIPESYYLVDVETNNIERLHKSRPWLEELELSNMHPISYRSRDGVLINSYITLPRKCTKTKSIPLVVFPHGGPWKRNSWSFSPVVQLFASIGLGVLQVNFRGSSGYGESFKNAGYKERGRKIQDDIVDGVNYLLENREYSFDEKRVGIFGGSFGGYSALCGLAFTPKLFKCGVSINGPTDLFYGLNNLSPKMQIYKNLLYKMIGHPENDYEYLKSASPIFFTDQIESPVLFIHGKNDTRVPIAQVEQMISILKSNRKSVETLVFENEGHIISKEENLLQTYQTVCKFFKRHLLQII